jgi:hypothetical protein
MTATEFLQVIAGLWVPLFVSTSMIATGLSLITAQARQPRMLMKPLMQSSSGTRRATKSSSAPSVS